MSTQRLAEAIEKLRGAYGGLEAELAARPPRCWSTLVDVVAGGPKAKSSDSVSYTHLTLPTILLV